MFLLIYVAWFVLGRWQCELTGDVVSGGQWHERHAALCDLPHFTLIDDEPRQPAAATSSDDSQLDAAMDGLEEIDIS